MENALIPPSVAELLTALQYLKLKSSRKIDPTSVLWRLFSATEQMLIELCEKSGEIPDKKMTLGRYVYLLSQRQVINTALRRKFDVIISARNYAVHTHSIDLADDSSIHEIKERVIELFRWYLSKCNLGPNLTEDEISTLLRDTTNTAEQVTIVPRRIFLCYAKEDYKRVEQIYEKLRERGHKPWMDKKDLLPGQDWEFEINRAIKLADFFVACMSKFSVAKKGFVQKEVRFALDVLGEIPPGQIFLIPLRLEPCEVPPTLSFLHWLDLNVGSNFKKLFESIEKE